MGGVGSGNWYRFDKKTTTDECHSVDVRYLHRKGLLMPGRWFSLRWSRAGRGDRLHQGCSEWRRPARADYLTLPPSKRVRRGMGRCAGARAPELDSVQLRWGEAMVRLPWSGLRQEGSTPLRTWPLLPVPSLLRARLRESARGQDVPGLEKGTEDKEAPRRERVHDGAIP